MSSPNDSADAGVRGARFEEEHINQGFRRVRNRLRKHRPEDIVVACIKKLNERPNDTIEQLRFYPPWRLLLLLKWAVLYGDYLSPNRRPLTVSDFNHLVNLMHDLAGLQKAPSDIKGLFLFLRKMAFQQFWLQHLLSPTVFARQSILFDAVDDVHPFKKGFLTRHGITITQFVELAALLIAACVAGEARLMTVASLHAASPACEEQVAQRFLRLLAVTFEELQARLLDAQGRVRTVSREFYEQTPLRSTPLLEFNGAYYPLSPALLVRSLENLAYDTLRDVDPQAFMDRFAPVFERYVGSSLARMNLPTLSETELRRRLGPGKVVDFLIEGGGVRVLIDAKGVEMSYLGMVEDDPDIIKDKTGNSIVKGIEQGFETITRLNAMQKHGETVTESQEDYLLIVTFKELFLGNGRQFYESVATDKLNELTARFGDHPPIPFEHMYFLSIDDLDLAVSAVMSGKIALADMLQRAVHDDSSFQTAKFTFKQHVFEMCPDVDSPPWLVTVFKSILDRCESAMLVQRK